MFATFKKPVGSGELIVLSSGGTAVDFFCNLGRLTPLHELLYLFSVFCPDLSLLHSLTPLLPQKRGRRSETLLLFSGIESSMSMTCDDFL